MSSPTPPTQKGIAFLDGLVVGPSTTTTTTSTKPQELTLSYLCENNTKPQKGKEIMVSSPHNSSFQEGKQWVERDFLSLSSETKKRQALPQVEVGEEENGHERLSLSSEERKSMDSNKKQKLEMSSTLNLSLALPDISLSLTSSNGLQNNNNCISNNRNNDSSVFADHVIRGSLHSFGAAPSNNNNNINSTTPTCSNDFTAASLSNYSYSHPFSHNPSCSLTCNSTENYEYSVGREDQIWCGGEGTNGSVHSRFRPIGDAGIVALNSSMMQGSRVVNKDSGNNSVYMAASSDNISFYPSELPARPRVDTYSGDSRRRGSENLRGIDAGDEGGRQRKISRPEMIVREILSESIPVMAKLIRELGEEVLGSTKEYVRNVILLPEKQNELVSLQKLLERRSDLTKESLSKGQKDQLEILVAIKMGLASYVSGKVRLPCNELVEIFLFMRCRNVNCKSLLPIDDCDCKFCSAENGFCSSCMCPVCMKFDCASNTCSWVGCDLCSHWCHAACGLEKNLIRPSGSLKGRSGSTEMQFHCLGCNHASEMFGFVKDVFVCCAKDWGHEILIKELDCVAKIFKGSEDYKGKELHVKAVGLLSKLETKSISPTDACKILIQFFNYAEGMPDFPVSGASAKDLMPAEAASRAKEPAAPVPVKPAATSIPPKQTILNSGSLSHALLGDRKIEDEFQLGMAAMSKKDEYETLESIVRIKEAEARMFQNKADEARREAEGYLRMIRAKSEKLDEEYTDKIGKLCLQETEERRRKKLEELKVLENSHCNYFNMKLRMQAEIAGLLERMEATKQQWV